MFRGSSYHTIDPKGRVIIPSRFREGLKCDGEEDGIMISKMDGCLVAYGIEDWRKIEDRVLALPQRDDAMRRFRRVFIGGAFWCPADKQDRILIPPDLRQYAGLSKNIVLVGVLDHFEVWSRSNWDNEGLKHDEEMRRDQNLRNAIDSLGL